MPRIGQVLGNLLAVLCRLPTDNILAMPTPGSSVRDSQTLRRAPYEGLGGGPVDAGIGVARAADGIGEFFCRRVVLAGKRGSQRVLF